MSILKKILYIIVSVALLLSFSAVAAYYWLVILKPGDEIQQDNIQKILAMESPVFYQDGQTKLGVFFQKAHRQYVHFRNIPPDFINAIVASEDNEFFSHSGIDVNGIIRALIANLQAGKIVQGGSTITQQAAKNLFKRKGRSISSKLKELIFALQLEYHYSKEKIMEFYANQFYVSGNGHGLGVAARYYFDKPVPQLTLIECAFIAGSVKRPNYYNPFTKDNDEDVELAKIRAKNRTGYVLHQMQQLGFITDQQYMEQMNGEISFKKGKMKYPLNSIMDMVKKSLNSPEVEEALAQHGIENVSTSGIRIITTVDKDLQNQAYFSLRKELSRLDVRLTGYDRNEVQNSYADLSHQNAHDSDKGTFLFGRITEINDSGEPSISVAFDHIGKTGRVDEKGLMPLLSSLIKWKKQRWSEADIFDLPVLFSQLQVDDTVFVSIRETDPETHDYTLDLEKYPEIQGAIVTMHNGRILALVGGFENHFFNRAVSAKRPMGSVMKPLVYAAAIQLGWNSSDALNNTRDVFIFQDQAYFPRPDHFSPHSQVSMNWAGVNSENLATVWLLYHLCDHLTPGQFRDLAQNVGLARQPDETYGQYADRMRDQYGLVIGQDVLYRAAFKKAVKDLEVDLLFAGNLKEYEIIKKLHYGLNFDKYLEEIEQLTDNSEEISPQRLKRLEKEVETRQEILNRNFLNLINLRKEFFILQNDISTYDTEQVNGSIYRDKVAGTFAYFSDIPPTDNWQYINKQELIQIINPPLSFFGIKPPEGFWKNILIGGLLSSEFLDLLEKYVENEYQRLSGLRPYSEEVLHTIQDFRITVGLHYVTNLGYALGIKSALDPVLSFPLGSNVISLLETAKIYEAFANGGIFVDSEAESLDDFAVINRIEDSDGDLIFEPDRTLQKVFDPKTTLAVSSILRNVTKFGTGRYALNNVKLLSKDSDTSRQLRQLNLQVPLFGKTGTANRFTNAAFAGYIPGLASSGNGLTNADGYTIVSYVGYDDNTPMVRNNTHITGSAGALPMWSRMANSILLDEGYGTKLDLVDITFSAAATSGRAEIPFQTKNLGQGEFLVNKGNGLISPDTSFLKSNYDSDATTIITFGSIKENGKFESLRYFQPFWANK